MVTVVAKPLDCIQPSPPKPVKLFRTLCSQEVCYAHESLQHPLTEVNFAIRSPGCCDNLSKFLETEDTTFVRGILGALLQPRVDPLSLLRDEVPVEPPLQARIL